MNNTKKRKKSQSSYIIVLIHVDDWDSLAVLVKDAAVVAGEDDTERVQQVRQLHRRHVAVQRDRGPSISIGYQIIQLLIGLLVLSFFSK